MTRRKTCFQTGVTISPNKAKPTTATTAFCLYLHPLIVKANRGKKQGSSPTSTTIYSVVARTKLYHATHPTFSPITMRNSPVWHSRPLGRVREWTPQAAVFSPPKADFLNGRRPFFIVAADDVMLRMTEEMESTTHRKARFPTVGADISTKVMPTSAATAFCLYLHPLIVKANRGKKHGNSPTSTNSYSVVARTKLYHATHPIISPIAMRNSPG